MPTFIKTGYWESAVKSYKGWLNLEDLISGIAISGSGTAGQLAFWTNTTVQSGSSNLVWDSVNSKLGIGVSVPSGKLTVYHPTATGITPIGAANNSIAYFASNGNSLYHILLDNQFSGTSAAAGIRLANNAGLNVQMYLGSSTHIQSANRFTIEALNTASISLQSRGGDIDLVTGGDSPTFSKLRVFLNGNVGIGTNLTDAGFKLDVNGTARVQGTFVATGTSVISSIPTIGTYNAFSTFNVVNDGPASIAVDRFSSNAISPHFNLRKSRGTSAAPTIVSTSDELGYIGFWGHDGTAFQRTGIILVRAENVTGTTITPTMRFGVGTSAASNQYYITIYNSGQVAFGNGAPEVASAAVSILSTTKGFLPPRMTTTQKTAIVTPTAGLQVYDTTLNQMSYYNGTTWVNF